MILSFCTHIQEPNTEVDILTDLETLVDVDLDWFHGEPRIDVHAVYINGVDILHSKDVVFQQLACIIADKAEDDGDLLDRLMEAEDGSPIGSRESMRRVFA